MADFVHKRCTPSPESFQAACPGSVHVGDGAEVRVAVVRLRNDGPRVGGGRLSDTSVSGTRVQRPPFYPELTLLKLLGPECVPVRAAIFPPVESIAAVWLSRTTPGEECLMQFVSWSHRKSFRVFFPNVFVAVGCAQNDPGPRGGQPGAGAAYPTLN